MDKYIKPLLLLSLILNMMLLYIWGFTSFNPKVYQTKSFFDRHFERNIKEDGCIITSGEFNLSPDPGLKYHFSCVQVRRIGCDVFSETGKRQCLETGIFWGEELNEQN